MKYLNKFNESTLTELEKFNNLKSFCNESLAYLIDEGFVVLIGVSNHYQIELRKDPYGSFKYEAIKEDFLPFIEAIHDKYQILTLDRTNKNNIRLNGLRSNGEYLMDDLIEENVSIGFPILSIKFNISSGNY